MVPNLYFLNQETGLKKVFFLVYPKALSIKTIDVAFVIIQIFSSSPNVTLWKFEKIQLSY